MKNSYFLKLGFKYIWFYKIYLIYNIYIRHFKFFFFKSYSQFKEDLFILSIFKKKGFYIDIGCNHPIRYNDTFLLYKYGWSGINIDLSKINIDLCNLIRPRDINICEAISKSNKKIKIYIPNNNSASYEITTNERYYRLLKKMKKNKYKYKLAKAINFNSLKKKYYLNFKMVDFLKIDIEGSDFEILKSLDIKKLKPKIIMIETPDFDLKGSKKICQYLKKNKYKKIYFNSLNSIFKINKVN